MTTFDLAPRGRARFRRSRAGCARNRDFPVRSRPADGSCFSARRCNCQNPRPRSTATAATICWLWRWTVGFDRLFNLLEDSLEWTEDNYPPYNIERSEEDRYRISLALAGFSPDEVTITAEQNVLTVEGRKASKGTHQYLYQGISWRPFRRQFNLAEYVQVKGASFEDGMLKIDLLREVPEALKPRQIPINAVNDNEKLEHKQTG